MAPSLIQVTNKDWKRMTTMDPRNQLNGDYGSLREHLATKQAGMTDV